MTRNSLALVVASLALAAVGARATEVDLQLTTIGQAYQTRTLGGELLDRRRIAQWASLRAMRLFDLEALQLELRLRFDTDLGLPAEPDGPAGGGIELLGAWIRLDRLLGRLDLTLGRQLLLDEIDFVQFDGLRLDLRLPLGFELRLLSGLAVRDRSWLAGGLLELDGLEQGETPAPLVGAGLHWNGDWFALGLDYRRVVLWVPGWPLDAEHLAVSGGVAWPRRQFGLDAAASYDLAQDRLQRLRADAWARLPWLSGLGLQAGFLQSRPQFALDSIFHFFSPAPFWQLSAGLVWEIDWPAERAGSLWLGYHHRGYQEPADGPAPDVAGSRVDGLDLDGRWRFGPDGWLWLSLGFEDGAAGQRWLASPGLVWSFSDQLQFDGRLILVSVDEPLDDAFDAVTLGGSVGLRWCFGPGRAVLVTGELNSNRVHPLRLRLLAVLDLAFSYGPGGFR